MMTLDEAIAHAEWCAENSCGECAEEHAQLADWLRELRRARIEIDLLKTLRDGFKADARKHTAENDRLLNLLQGAVNELLEDCGDCWGGLCEDCDCWLSEHAHELRALGIEVEG